MFLSEFETHFIIKEKMRQLEKECRENYLFQHVPCNDTYIHKRFLLKLGTLLIFLGMKLNNTYVLNHSESPNKTIITTQSLKTK